MDPHSRDQIEHIFRHHFRHLVKYIQKIARCSKDVAEDLAQDVFAAAITSGARVSHPSGWIWGAARNRSAHHVRDTARRRGRQTELEMLAGTGEHPGVRMEHLLDASSLLQRVLRVLQRVAPRRRRLLVMMALEGKTVDQIARELDLRRSTASGQIRGLRRMLTACIQDDPISAPVLPPTLAVADERRAGHVDRRQHRVLAPIRVPEAPTTGAPC